MTIEEFRSKWPYPLYFMPIDLTISLYHKVAVGKDGIVRLREVGDYDDAGIPVTAITGNMEWVNKKLGK